MHTPKFNVGDQVVIGTNRDNPNQRPGAYRIVRTMPFDRNHGFQYRAKSLLDSHERVLGEAEISAA